MDASKENSEEGMKIPMPQTDGEIRIVIQPII